MPFCQIALKVTQYLGYFFKKICGLDLSKVAQSGHTGICSIDVTTSSLASIACHVYLILLIKERQRERKLHTKTTIEHFEAKKLN